MLMNNECGRQNDKRVTNENNRHANDASNDVLLSFWLVCFVILILDCKQSSDKKMLRVSVAVQVEGTRCMKQIKNTATDIFVHSFFAESTQKKQTNSRKKNSRK